MAPNPDDGWEAWANHVLITQNRLSECYERLDERVTKIGEEIAALKVRAGIWGFLGGALVVAIGLGVQLLRSIKP